MNGEIVFKIDHGLYRRKFLRGLASEAMISMLGVFLMVFPVGWLPEWAPIALVVSGLTIVFFSVYSFLKPRSANEELEVIFFEDSLGVRSQGTTNRIKFNNLKIEKITEKSGAVALIHLKDNYGNSLKFDCFSNLELMKNKVLENIK